MKKIAFSMFVFSIGFVLNLNAERYIQPTKYENQEQFFIKGGSVLASSKINSVLMYQTSKTIKSGRANFYFSISNKTARPVNFYTSNLQVTDQWGRPVRIVSKKEHVANKKSSRNWSLFTSALLAGLESLNAQSAGEVSYQSQTSEYNSSSFNVGSSRGRASGSLHGQRASTTTGTIQVEALRRQAQREAQEDAFHRSRAIKGKYRDWEHRLDNFYFDTTTIFPGDAYAANFQIDVSRDVEKELQYLLFTYYIGEEEHTFCFYCGAERKKRHRFSH